MTPAGCNHVQRHAGVEQRRFMAAAKVVQPQLREAEPTESLLDPFAGVIRIPGLSQGKLFTSSRRVREHQGIIRQLDERQVDLLNTVRNAGDES